MTEKDKNKLANDVASWRPSKQAKELLEKVKGEDRKKLLNKLVEEALRDLLKKYREKAKGKG